MYPYAVVYLYKGNTQLYWVYGHSGSGTFIQQTSLVAYLSPSLIIGSDYHLRVVDYYNTSFYGDSAPFSVVSFGGSSFITVTSPCTGELLLLGTNVTIQWDQSGLSSYFFSIFLLKGQSDVAALKTNSFVPLQNAGSLIKSVELSSTLAAGSDYSVKVVSESDPTVFGISGVFSLIGTGSGSRFILVTPSSLTFTPPVNMGYSFSGVGFNSMYPVADVYMYKGNTQLYWLNRYSGSGTIIQLTLLVAYLNPSLIIGSDYHLRVVDYYNTSFYGDSAPFSIVSFGGSCSITVASPWTGELFSAGTNVTIQWDQSGLSSYFFSIFLLKGQSVVAALKTNSFVPLQSTWGNLMTSVELSSTLAAGSDYSVKVVSESDPTVFGISGVFSLVGTGSGSRFISVAASSTSLAYTPSSYYGFSFSGVGFNSMDPIADVYLYKGNTQLYWLNRYFVSGTFIQLTSLYVYLNPSLITGSDYHLRVVDYSNTSFYGDSAPFSIVYFGGNCSITVASPWTANCSRLGQM